MSPFNTWTFLLLLCINSIVYSKKCILTQDNQKDLPKEMLNNFQHMIPENETLGDCLTNVTLPTLTNIYQVESAAIMVRELYYGIIQFYTKHQEKLVSNQTAWEQLQEDLDYQADLLEGCISRTTEKKRIVQEISEYFSKLEEILEEQDDAVCARRIIHVNINRNLLWANNLSTLMRKRYFNRTPQ